MSAFFKLVSVLASTFVAAFVGSLTPHLSAIEAIALTAITCGTTAVVHLFQSPPGALPAPELARVVSAIAARVDVATAPGPVPKAPPPLSTALPAVLPPEGKS